MDERSRAITWVCVPWAIAAILVVASVIQHAETNQRLDKTPTDVLVELDEIKVDYAKRFDVLGQELEQRTRDRFTSREAEKLEARLRAIESKVGIDD